MKCCVLFSGLLRNMVVHRLDEVQLELCSWEGRRNKMFMGLLGKHPFIMRFLRGLVDLCKIYYGMFCGRTKDKEREEQA